MDFQKARFNMVEQQIRPWNVLDFDILDALEDIPREKFVQKHQYGYAYADMSLQLANGGYMQEPKIVARMVQALTLRKSDSVLEVGTGSGYATLLLGKLAAEVLSVDIDAQQQAIAQSSVKPLLSNENIRFQHSDGLDASQFDDEFDAIYIGGSLPEVPEALLNRLKADGGRMVVMVGTAPLQHCYLITRTGSSEFQRNIVFDGCIAGLNDKSLPKTHQFQF